MKPYKKTTNVEQTWREHGYIPPREDPATVAKWRYFQTLGASPPPPEAPAPTPEKD